MDGHKTRLLKSFFGSYREHFESIRDQNGHLIAQMRAEIAGDRALAEEMYRRLALFGKV